MPSELVQPRCHWCLRPIDASRGEESAHLAIRDRGDAPDRVVAVHDDMCLAAARQWESLYGTVEDAP